MELVNYQDLKKLPVESVSGRLIGRLVGLELETNSLVVENLVVKPKSVIKGIVEGNLIIHRDQVIEISHKKIIVDDVAVQNPQIASQISVVD